GLADGVGAGVGQRVAMRPGAEVRSARHHHGTDVGVAVDRLAGLDQLGGHGRGEGVAAGVGGQGEDGDVAVDGKLDLAHGSQASLRAEGVSERRGRKRMGTGVKLGVLASGSGTNLQAIIDAGLPVAVVVTDRPGVAALDRAAAAGIPTVVVDRDGLLPDRVAFTEAIVAALRDHDVDLVAMAGFMTVLAEPMFAAFPGRVVNTHPSLLPSFRGAHAVAEALAAGVKVTGCTIHIATIEVDDGPILAQEAVPVLDGDDEEALHDRIKAVEHRLYPGVLADLLSGGATGAAEAVEAEPVALAADGPIPVRRALVSVYDKTGLIDFARGLADLGVTLLASGGTATALAEAGVPVTPVEEVTGAPEMLGGRVKTLHPRIHGGILADRGEVSHGADLAAQGIEPIDLVVVNLYPFLSGRRSRRSTSAGRRWCGRRPR